MRRSPLTLAAALGALTLSACSQGGEDKAADAGAPVDASPAAAGGPATAADLPRLRPGVWRISTVDGDGPADVVTQCIGPNEPLDLPGQSEGCVDSYSRVAGGVRLDSRCTRDGMETSMRTDITGDFQTSSLIRMELKVSMPGQPPMTKTMRATGAYMGACAAGQEPGIIQDGI